MTTTTFQSGSNDHSSAGVSHAVGEFTVAWFEATPAYLVLRPAAAFLREWIAATPVGILLNLSKH
ncbi:hypothetical protein [Azospirillum picis]|uniref:Uncharacterized protein n=1 Tax=Azospirillum picis TaxID=488438 RepID=A0ABU0MFY2_9PROT|nr:hypothetical protein [Azospirillum picis]MBP2298608.1 hypothetical protein [Azospirillum picis]MDQ0532343.1 hypothetical protein [Azospirillum picis]